MATLTLGQMLDAALGSPRTEVIDFEQLRNLLNGMLVHLGLRDLPVQESGEPLEGAEGSPFSASFLEELKQKVEANEKEIAEVRALCQELREEVNEIKVEQSRMAEDMQKMQETFDTENFQNMMDDLRNQLMDTVMSTMQDMMGQGKQGSQDWLQEIGPQLTRPWEDQGLIVIGNEITLLERPRTPVPRHGDTRPISPLPPKARAQGRGKDLLQANESGHHMSFGANDMGQNVGRHDTGWNMGRNRGRSDMGQNDMGRNDMGWNVGQKDMGRKGMARNVQWSDTGQNDMGQDDIGQDDKGRIKDKEIETSISKAEALPSHPNAPPEMTNVGEIKDEEIKISISKAEALPSRPDAPPEMTDVGQIKDEETKVSISKAPPHVQEKGLDGGFTASRMHPGVPGTHLPGQQVQAARGHPGSQTLWIPAESVAGTSRRLPTSEEARGGGSSRMEPSPADAGLRLIKVPSSKYLPCGSAEHLPGRHSESVPSSPPLSPRLSGRLPHALKPGQAQEQREQAAEGYSRRSPRYCGGKHTSTCPVQPMEPLLPNPNKPGAFDLVGRDGLVYRGRAPVGME